MPTLCIKIGTPTVPCSYKHELPPCSRLVLLGKASLFFYLYLISQANQPSMNSTFTIILRIILALTLLIFGFNKFLSFIPLFEMPPAAANFIDSLDSSGYVLYVVAILEIGIGLLLLLKKWVPFALILLAPITINILLFHMFLDVSGIGIAILVVFLNTMLIFKYWKAYKTLFQ